MMTKHLKKVLLEYWDILFSCKKKVVVGIFTYDYVVVNKHPETLVSNITLANPSAYSWLGKGLCHCFF
jgi:hypothetical protein